MTSTILMIRHAAHSQVDQVLSGRTPGIGLSQEGRSQARKLTRRLDGTPIAALQASPVQRAQETASVIAADRPGLTVETASALEELDFGDWAGRAFVELAEDPQWGAWNSAREAGCAPNGETMVAAQQRAWLHVQQAAADWPDRTVVMVTHCDIIRAVIARVLGLSLDYIHRFEIAPASISRLAVGAWGAKVLAMNEQCHD